MIDVYQGMLVSIRVCMMMYIVLQQRGCNFSSVILVAVDTAVEQLSVCRHSVLLARRGFC